MRSRVPATAAALYLPTLLVLAQPARPATAPKPPEVMKEGAQCPDTFKAVCLNDCGGWTAAECGWHPAHNVAYALRVGHLDWDTNSGLLYNPGPNGHKPHQFWDWFEPPTTCDGWCGPTDHGWPEPLHKTKPPPDPPSCPSVVRCIDGSEGRIDWSKYPDCCASRRAGAPPPGGGGSAGPPPSGSGKGAASPFDKPVNAAISNVVEKKPELVDPQDPTRVKDVEGFNRAVVAEISYVTGMPPARAQSVWQGYVARHGAGRVGAIKRSRSPVQNKKR